ncbi:MAG: cell wall-binding repeat-containing protein [Gracilibacteraceae bacterium]|jgi:hypothetical protein|nr:cell wall-binding repeat-containing protein [Gracilibacteraceae bacterium]
MPAKRHMPLILLMLLTLVVSGFSFSKAAAPVYADDKTFDAYIYIPTSTTVLWGSYNIERKPLTDAKLIVKDSAGSDVPLETWEVTEGYLNITNKLSGVTEGEYDYELYYKPKENEPEILASYGRFLITEKNNEFKIGTAQIKVWNSNQSSAIPNDQFEADFIILDQYSQQMIPLQVKKIGATYEENYVLLSGQTYTYSLVSNCLDYNILEGNFTTFRGTTHYIADDLAKAATMRFGFNTTTTFRITKGADFGVYKKIKHFTQFYEYPLDLVQSDGDYDVYTGKIPQNAQLHYEASLPDAGSFPAPLKESRLFTLPTSAADTTVTFDLSDWQYTGYSADPTRQEANLYTNLGPTGSVNLSNGESFDLDLIRVWQAMFGVVANYFIEPNYELTVYGDSVGGLEEIGAPGRLQTRITAEGPGVSVVKIVYGPQIYKNAGMYSLEISEMVYFDPIMAQNTGVAVINVDGGPDFETGIDARHEFDTYYFDREQTDRALYTFTPAQGTSVRVHDPLHVSEWGEAWTDYEAAEDGSFTVGLKEGRNIVELKNGESTRYHVIEGRGLEFVIENVDRPGEVIAVGDTARVSFKGLRSPIQKIGGVYNPGFGGTTWVEYTNIDEATVRSAGNQYGIGWQEANYFDYTVTAANLGVLTGGQIHQGGLGSSLYTHINISLSGVGINMTAGAIPSTGYFSALPDITLIPQVPPATDIDVVFDPAAETKLTVRAANGETQIPKEGEPNVYSLAFAEGYRYIYEKPGYLTKTGEFAVTAETASFTLPLFTDADKIAQSAGTARVTVVGPDSYLADGAPVSYDAVSAPNLMPNRWVEYNYGGYTVLHALIDALGPGNFSAAAGELTPHTLTAPPAGAVWYCEVNGRVVADYWRTHVHDGDEIRFYLGAPGQTLAWFSPAASEIRLGESATLTLLGKPVGADGDGEAVAGARVLVNNTDYGLVTDAAGQVEISPAALGAGLPLGPNYLRAARADALTFNRAAINVLPAQTPPQSSVTFRLIGAVKHPSPDGYGPFTEYQNWIRTLTYDFTGAETTVFEVFDWALAQKGLDYVESMEGYISTIQAPEALGSGYLEETDNGPNSGWMYTVNGVHGDNSLRQQKLSDGDQIIWHYVDDYILETDYEGSPARYPNRWLEAEDVDPETYGPPAPPALEDGTAVGRTEQPAEIVETNSGVPAAAVTVDAQAVADAVTEALERAAAETESGADAVATAVEIRVEIIGNEDVPANEVKEVYVTLPAAAVGIITGQDGGVDNVRIASDLGDISLDREAILTAARVGEDLSFVLGGLNAGAAAEKELRLPALDGGGIPLVYEISLYSVRSDTAKITQITNLGDGRATVSLPYVLPSGGNPLWVAVWYIQPGAPAEKLNGVTYDQENSRAVFMPNHFSYYAVGYDPVVVPDVPKPHAPNGGSAVSNVTPPVTPADPAAPITVSRASLSYISGADRVLTSVAISRQGWESAETVILAPGGQNNLIDALAVAPLAGQEDAPILLSTGSLDPAVIAEIQRLGAKKVYAVGALSGAVIEALEAALPGLAVETLRGASRFETAALIGAKLSEPQGTFVVGYNAVADAVSAASFAAAHGYLIQIADPDGTVSVAAGTPATGAPVYILGGPALVRDIPGATRLYGATRYETNKAIRDALPFEYANIYTADGGTLVDALTGSALAARSGAAIVLTPGNDPAGTDFGGITAETKVYAFGAAK